LDFSIARADVLLSFRFHVHIHPTDMSEQTAPSLSSSPATAYQAVSKDVNCRLLNIAWLALLDPTLRCDYVALFCCLTAWYKVLGSNKGVMAAYGYHAFMLLFFFLI
jgi:hypothetical protein